MNQHKKINKLFTIILIFASLQIHPITQVNPQPGENLWHLTASIGTAVDEIAASLEAADSAATFSTLHVILDKTCTVNSKLDVIEEIVEQDFSQTFSALNSLAFCNPIQLTIPPTGTTILNSGVYCLNNDVNLGASNNITINASDVYFDLNGHTIFDGSGFIIFSPQSRITVTNGSFQNGTGMRMNGFNKDINLTNLHFSNVPTALSNTLAISTNLVLKNIEISNVSLTAIDLLVTNCLIENCNIRNGMIGSTGFDIRNTSNNVILKNCGTYSVFSGFLIENQNCNLNNCIAYNCTMAGFTFEIGKNIAKNCIAIKCAPGFLVESTDSLPIVLENCINIGGQTAFQEGSFAVSSQSADVSMINCISTKNNSSGFSIQNMMPGISTAQILFEKCLSTNNTRQGFQCEQNFIATLTQCKTLANSISGFVFSSITTPTGSVENCTSVANVQNGFSNIAANNNDIIFSMNNSMLNGTNYNSIGNESSSQHTLTSNARLYGDNLKNM